MDSEPMDSAELSRRLRIIEGALGIELDSSPDCSGDPSNCEADPCTPERCPVTNNTVHRMAMDLAHISGEHHVLKQLVEVLTEEGIVSAKMLRKAHLRVQLAEVQKEVQESEQALLTVSSGSVVGQILSTGTERLRQRADDLRSLLREQT